MKWLIVSVILLSGCATTKQCYVPPTNRELDERIKKLEKHSEYSYNLLGDVIIELETKGVIGNWRTPIKEKACSKALLKAEGK